VALSWKKCKLRGAMPGKIVPDAEICGGYCPVELFRETFGNILITM